MELYFRYIILSTLCLSILYAGYLVFQKIETRPTQLRCYLLCSIVLSLTIPLSTFHIEIDFFPHKYEAEVIDKEVFDKEMLSVASEIDTTAIPIQEEKEWNTTSIMVGLYFLGLVTLLTLLLVQLGRIFYLFKTSQKLRKERIVLFEKNNESAFTFFNWIFIPGTYYKENELKDIISHERIHAKQYHSIDLLIVELIVALMWFNPLVWIMKNSFRLVHEYLADEGVLNNGTDQLKYQALLINQVAEGRLINLSSNFSNSLLKKRIIMMTKRNKYQGSKWTIFSLIPLAAILLLAVACVNGDELNENAKTITVVVDAGHGGIDPGARLNDEICEKDIVLSIVKTLKEKASSNANLKLVFTRLEDNSVSLEKRPAINADLLLSIHTDVSPPDNPTKVEGVGIVCLVSREAENKVESKKVGQLLVSELNQLDKVKTSLRESNFYILKNSKCPAIICSIGNLADEDDLAFITDKANQELLCEKFLNVINQLN